MGSSIAKTMVEEQKKVQKEMQAEMMKAQMQNQLRGQERMRRMQIAQMMAIQRERLYWLGGVYGVVLAGWLGAMARIRPIPVALKGAVGPLSLWGVLLGYQYDFAYGNKPERINKIYNDITTDPRYWFNPLLPDEVNDPTPKNQK